MRHILAIFLGAALIAPATASATRYGFSVAASDSLSTSTSCEAVTAVSGTDARSQAIPNRGRLGVLVGRLTSISSATEVTWYIAQDSAGEQALTDAVTETILDDDADGTGSIATSIDAPYAVTADGANGTLYICAKTDAGTATLVSRLFWEA